MRKRRRKIIILLPLALVVAVSTMAVLRLVGSSQPAETEQAAVQEEPADNVAGVESEYDNLPLPRLADLLVQAHTVAQSTTDQISELWRQQELAAAQAAAVASGTSSGAKVFTYAILVWGTVEADVNDFRAKVAETLNDARGWARAGWQFVEIADSSQAMFDIILSDPYNLEILPGCSGELSCTTWNNQVIINDVRWHFGTAASNAAGMSTRDYQHMVVNHEVGHWLGHYAHEESCPNGGPAPIMLQQSTGLRGCDSFNPWPLDWELWTLK